MGLGALSIFCYSALRRFAGFPFVTLAFIDHPVDQLSSSFEESSCFVLRSSAETSREDVVERCAVLTARISVRKVLQI